MRFSSAAARLAAWSGGSSGRSGRGSAGRGGRGGGCGTGRGGLLRAEGVHDHDHLAAFEQRHALDDAVLLEALGDREEQGPTAVRVRVLAATEPHRHLELVTLVEELDRRLHLGVDVVVVDLRSHPDLFPDDGLLLLLGVLDALLLLEPVLAVVEDLAHGRLRGRGDLDQVEALFLGLGVCANGRHDTELFAFGTDEADGGDPNLFVDPELGYRLGSRKRSEVNGAKRIPLMRPPRDPRRPRGA